MEISGGLNQPVEFFAKNTGNNINTLVPTESHSAVSNVFSAEINEQLNRKNISKSNRKSKKNKRLNLIDSEYLPDEVIEDGNSIYDSEENIFVSYGENQILRRFRKFFIYFIENTPLLNYFILKRKKRLIQNTVSKLNDISQNVDEMLNSAVPYGEEKFLYGKIANNLNQAANIIGKVNKVK